MPVAKPPTIIAYNRKLGLGSVAGARPLVVDKKVPSQVPRDTGIAEFSLATATTPATRTDHTIFVRARVIDALRGTIRVRLEPLAFNSSLLDDFNRADANPLDGNWVTPFSTGTNHAQVISNTSGASSGFEAIWNTQFGPDMEAWCSVPVLPGTAGDNVGVLARVYRPSWDASDNNVALYSFDVSSDGGGPAYSGRIHRRDPGGIITNITGGDTSIPSFIAGDGIGIRAVGTLISGYIKHDGVESLLCSATDTNYQHRGYIGFGGDNATLRIDDFGGGNYFLETPELPSSFQTYVLPLSDVQAATITDYSALQLWTWGHSVTGDPVSFEVADAWLATPSGGVVTIPTVYKAPYQAFSFPNF